MKALERELPGVPSIAEEAAARGDPPPHSDAFLLIDPIDGTREFIGRSPEFTVNLALIDKLQPIAGAIYAPAGARVWFAGAQGFTTKAAAGEMLPASQNWSALGVRPRPPGGLTALLSKSHLDEKTVALLNSLPIRERRPMGSSLKFCVIAQGKADIYPRFGRTMEWDTAAGDAILRAAGGGVLTPAGEPLAYGKADNFYRNGPFIAWGDAHMAATETYS
jgi:3'(2'), 5'-bisphosphate nucleotidase